MTVGGERILQLGRSRIGESYVFGSLWSLDIGLSLRG